MRQTCLTVLSHLILNDMMKVKGNISRIALCLVDEDSSIKVSVCSDLVGMGRNAILVLGSLVCKRLVWLSQDFNGVVWSIIPAQAGSGASFP